VSKASPKPNGILTLCSDFGSCDAYVGIMKGVALAIAPHLRCVDLTHEIPPQAVRIGALALRSAVEFFPAGTVHLAVVDPGVGSARRPVVAVTERGWLVGPDNGLLAPSAHLLGLHEVRVLENERYFHLPVSHTFHGRDIFAPCAAHLAAGVPAADLGAAVDGLQALEIPEPQSDGENLRGEVIYTDHFGNLITNIPAVALATFRPQRVSVTVGSMLAAPLVSTYAAVASGAGLALVGSWGLLEVAVRDGSAAALSGAGVGAVVAVTVS
jgi:S-adenosyl-L-methionine hydrolase (adenosine-forming)